LPGSTARCTSSPSAICNARTGVDRSSDDLDDLARQLDNGQLASWSGLSRRHAISAPAWRMICALRLPACGRDWKYCPKVPERSDALEEAERLAGIFDTIMRVARIEAAQGTEPTDSSPWISAAPAGGAWRHRSAPWWKTSGKQLHVTAKRTATVDADRKMLVQALANLIQNAIVHGGPGHHLVRQRPGDRRLPTMARASTQRCYDEITKPMVRLDAARESDGAGLGLALVRAVADRHGARAGIVALNRPHGLRVALKFTETVRRRSCGRIGRAPYQEDVETQILIWRPQPMKSSS
jgi:signal transduction histidine kinase